MKKKLLFALLLTSGFTQAQSLTQANEPAIGANQTMFLCDSLADNYSGVTGPGVTWNYSTIMGYPGQDKTVSVLDATTTSDYSSFPGSAKAYEIGNTVVTYFNSDAAHRYSQGFKFYEATIGDVFATFENDSLTMVAYPFAYGDYLTDTYAGTMDFTFNGLPVNEALAGNAYAWIDGSGTMLFPMGVTVSNVIRYKSIDTSTTNLPIVGAVEIIREQYEYYDLASQDLPIFIHVTITMAQAGGGLQLAEISLVLSLYTPDSWAGIEEGNVTDFNLFPNPATESLTIQTVSEGAQSAVIGDQTGRVLKTIELASMTTVDVSDLQDGVYFIRVTENGSSITKQFVKK